MIKDTVKRNEKGQFIKGFRHSKKWKRYIGEKMYGRKITWKDKISKSLLGHPGQHGKDNYFYGKHFIPWNKGKRHSIATRRKISQAQLGRKLSEEHKKKIGEAIKKLGIKPPIIKGARHYCWKGGITPLVEKIRKSDKFRQWRLYIFQRDSFTCQFCGKRGCYLEVHHSPKRFSVILKEFEIKTTENAFACKQLWDVNNGITLCQTCHNLTKRKYEKHYLFPSYK